MIRLINLCVILMITFFSIGCTSDMKEIQNMNYASAIGVDFKDGEYNIYIQLVGLSNVATTEGDAAPQTYVSKTSAPTFIDAFFEVYKTGQSKFIWSHITAILLSESVLKDGIDNIFDGITRYYEFRLTPWVFATKEPIEELLSVKPFFDQPLIETVLHEPERIYNQSSMIRPIELHHLGRELFEPAMTTYIPSITINTDVWKKDQEVEPKLELDGAFFLKNEQYKGFYNLEQLNGLRWVESKTKRVATLVPGEENTEFLVVIDELDTESSLKETSNSTQFEVNVYVEGSNNN